MFFKTNRPTLNFSLMGDELKLKGQVSLATVGGLTKQIQKQGFPVLKNVDWSEVVDADSCGLALMLMLQSQQTSPIVLINLPDKVQTLLHLYDLDEVFQMQQAHDGDNVSV